MSPEKLARRYVWWQNAETTLRDVPYLLRQILNLGTAEDYVEARSLWGEEGFKEALLTAGPGAMDERSWWFWHHYFHLPITPMPRRSFA